MPHNVIYEQFKRFFPAYTSDTIIWFPNGKGSIRVRLYKNLEFVFTYHSANDWSFATLDHWIMNHKVVLKKV